jgi:hypothetical protein
VRLGETISQNPIRQIEKENPMTTYSNIGNDASSNNNSSNPPEQTFTAEHVFRLMQTQQFTEWYDNDFMIALESGKWSDELFRFEEMLKSEICNA